MARTRQHYESDAEECRQRGFKVGDRLVGDEGRGPTVIELQYVGERRILAKTISHNGAPPKYEDNEGNWTLSCRDWEQAPIPAPQPVPLVERMIEAYRKHRLDPSPVPAMTAALRVALDEALGRETRDELSTFRQRLNGVRGGFDVALEFFIKDRRDRLLAPAAPVDPAVEASEQAGMVDHIPVWESPTAKAIIAERDAEWGKGLHTELPHWEPKAVNALIDSLHKGFSLPAPVDPAVEAVKQGGTVGLTCEWALRHLIEVYDAMGAPRGPARIMADAALDQARAAGGGKK